MFNEQKAAQMAAFFLGRRGGAMSHLKLMKLLYLADREAMRQFEFPISGDHMVSMPHGPVLSMTLNYMDGNIESSPGGWEEWISAKENHELSLRQPVQREALDELSDADIDILETVWTQFGHMSRWEIRDYTHDNCPEWSDPNGSSKPISPKDVFLALGRSSDVAEELDADIEAERSLNRLFAQV
ncbi:MAG: Panacea domain-containing protein [Anaerolineae bacterium]|nr:MAG: Panacea domain-containing protein [Anaerolineae bacterium]